MVAVGNPFGLGGTVTAGIVSARGRDIGAGPYDDYVQIDAPINKGNSGGPAFDMNGNVDRCEHRHLFAVGRVGRHRLRHSRSTAKLVVDQLKEKGYITRGWIGVQVQPVTADIADGLGLKQARGAMVDDPQANGPAAKAGIEAGDVITSFNGNVVKDSRDLARSVGAMAPGSQVKLDVLHKGESRTLMLTLGEIPNERQANAGGEQPSVETAGTPHLGLTLAPASEVDGAGQRSGCNVCRSGRGRRGAGASTPAT